MRHTRRILAILTIGSPLGAGCVDNSLTTGRSTGTPEYVETSNTRASASSPPSAQNWEAELSGLGSTSTGGAASNAGETPSVELEELDDSLVVERDALWAVEVGLYGIDQASISFLDSGVVRVHVWQAAGFDDTEYTYDAAGTLTSDQPANVGDYPSISDAFAVDPEGRFHLVRSEGGCRVMIDRVDTGKFGDSCKGGYGFARDGSYVSQVLCSEDSTSTRIRVHDVSRRALTYEKTIPLSCDASTVHYPTPPIVLTDAQRTRTIFSSPEHPQIWVFDWTSDEVLELPTHRDVNAAGGATVLNLSLSADGSRLVSVGASDGLAALDPETYAIVQRLTAVPYFTVFDKCDCRVLRSSVLAWSEDGRYLATTSTQGGVDVRDAQTLLRLVTLKPPANLTRNFNLSSQHGPVLVRFSPDAARLVALYPRHVAAYAVEPP